MGGTECLERAFEVKGMVVGRSEMMWEVRMRWGVDGEVVRQNSRVVGAEVP